MGYTYLTPYEAHELRNQRTSNIILEKIIDNYLDKLSKYDIVKPEFSFQGPFNLFVAKEPENV